jgi:hypothetical protein
MRKLTTSEFIARARAVHGNKYDYAFVHYVKNKSKVNIICKEHGLFEQTPNSHLLGQHCPKCSGKHRWTEWEFIDRARAVHGADKYNYSSVNHVSNSIKVSIICCEHGEFKQTPKSHLNGNGCPNCAGVKKHNNESFIASAMKIHGYIYDYSQVNYVNSHTKVSVNCPKHGTFEQTPNNHLSGAGCPGCAKYGFDTTRKASLYVLLSGCGRYMKIGITHNPKQRHTKLKSDTPFLFERIELIEGLGDQISNLEKKLLAEYRPVSFTKTFDGYSEWRLWDDSIRNKLLTFMNEG